MLFEASCCNTQLNHKAGLKVKSLNFKTGPVVQLLAVADKKACNES